MENKTGKKLEALHSALQNFEVSLSLLSLPLDANVIDAIESGQIKKFEFCYELLWKIMKTFLFEHGGIETNSPRATIKSFFSSNYCSNDEYTALLQMLDDRNNLSHLYSYDMMKVMLDRLPEYARLMHRMLDAVQKKQGE